MLFCYVLLFVTYPDDSAHFSEFSNQTMQPPDEI